MICNIPVLSFSTALYCITLLVFIEVIVYCVIHVCNSVYVWPPESLFVREKHNNSQNITICLKLIYLLKKYVKIYIYICTRGLWLISFWFVCKLISGNLSTLLQEVISIELERWTLVIFFFLSFFSRFMENSWAWGAMLILFQTRNKFCLN